MWAAEAGYSPSKRQFFLVSVCTRLSQTMGHFATLFSARPTLGSAEHEGTCWPSRPIGRSSDLCWRWVDYCGDRLANHFGPRGRQLWYDLRRNRSPDSKKEMALRTWHQENGCELRASSAPSATNSRWRKRGLGRCGEPSRVVAKLLAYMVGYRISQALGRRQTALKSLYR